MIIKLIKKIALLIFPFVFLVSCTSKDLTSLEEGTYFGSIDELDSSYVKYEDNKLFFSIYGDYFLALKKTDDKIVMNDDGGKIHTINFEQDFNLQKELKNGYAIHESERNSPSSATVSFLFDRNGKKHPDITIVLSDGKVENRNLKTSKFSVILAEEIPESDFPSIIYNRDHTEQPTKKTEVSNKIVRKTEAVYEEKSGHIYRIDGMESKYTYESSLVRNAVEEASKLSKIPIDNNYLVEENEMGELYIMAYSLETQDEIMEKYIFDPYTKSIVSEEDYGTSSSSIGAVSKIINEAIAEVESQTSYSDQYPYVLTGSVTDDDLIEIDIGMSDKNNSGELVTQDTAIYNPETKSLTKYPEKKPVSLDEDTIIENSISFIEEKTGYIEGDPYIYDATLLEGGPIVDIEVRAPGAGSSGTLSIVDKFQYNYISEKLWIYNSVEGRYNRY